MAYFAYILYSEEFNRFYKGHCENLDKRISQHNCGYTKATKPFIPWKLIYYEEFEFREHAIKREKYFKTAAGRRFLKKKLSFHEYFLSTFICSLTGNTSDFGSEPARTYRHK